MQQSLWQVLKFCNILIAKHTVNQLASKRFISLDRTLWQPFKKHPVYPAWCKRTIYSGKISIGQRYGVEQYNFHKMSNFHGTDCGLNVHFLFYIHMSAPTRKGNKSVRATIACIFIQLMPAVISYSITYKLGVFFFLLHSTSTLNRTRISVIWRRATLKLNMRTTNILLR